MIKGLLHKLWKKIEGIESIRPTKIEDFLYLIKNADMVFSASFTDYYSPCIIIKKSIFIIEPIFHVWFHWRNGWK